MSSRVSKSEPVWLVTRIRRKGERIGKFKAPDAQAAIDKAAELLKLDPEEKKRLAAARVAS